MDSDLLKTGLSGGVFIFAAVAAFGAGLTVLGNMWGGVCVLRVKQRTGAQLWEDSASVPGLQTAPERTAWVNKQLDRYLAEMDQARREGDETGKSLRMTADWVKAVAAIAVVLLAFLRYRLGF